MGKRKSRTPSNLQPKAKRTLDSIFSCPFCNSAKSVTCRLDRDSDVGSVACNSCSRKYASPISDLDVAIDVYHSWIDACEAADDEARDARQRQDQEQQAAMAAHAAARGRRQGGRLAAARQRRGGEVQQGDADQGAASDVDEPKAGDEPDAATGAVAEAEAEAEAEGGHGGDSGYESEAEGEEQGGVGQGGGASD